ncbi:MAG: hypothetical protein ABIH23_25010 [bacterium]
MSALPSGKCDEFVAPEVDLKMVIDSWSRLPEAVRRGIVAMVRALCDSDR